MRYSIAQSKNIATPEIDAFIVEVLEVCKKHGLCFGHEDEHGAFTVEKWHQRYIDWIAQAIDCTVEPPPIPEGQEINYAGLTFYVGNGKPDQPGYTTRRAVVKGHDSDDKDRWVVEVEGQGQVSYHKDTLRQIAEAQVAP